MLRSHLLDHKSYIPRLVPFLSYFFPFLIWSLKLLSMTEFLMVGRFKGKGQQSKGMQGASRTFPGFNNFFKKMHIFAYQLHPLEQVEGRHSG